ncbi:transposase [Rhodovulum sp. NI22]|nr:transposase [Rhodovulum sp. NI22]
MLNLSDRSRLKGFRSPRSVIGYTVWAYHRFALSLRDVEDLLAARGIAVSYETVPDWVARFGAQFAAKVQRDRPCPADKWHLDEVVVPIKGRKHWLWRAIDANGDVLNVLIQFRRNKAAAMRFLRKLLKAWGQPRVIITDKLRSYGAAKADVAPGIEHRQHKGLKYRAEASHRHTRRREKIMGRFKSSGQAQRFLSVHDQTAALFRPKRHRLSASSYRHARSDAFDLWAEYAVELDA